jgi:hypothetical protein
MKSGATNRALAGGATSWSIAMKPLVTAKTHLTPLQEFLESVDPSRGRLIFAIDATASRESAWDLATGITAEMFGAIDGRLDAQLVYYRGHRECVASRWLSDAKALATIMSKVTCRSGHTQIERVLAHVRKEHAREKVNAAVLIGDACEETPSDLYAEARELGVPVFTFQEGDDSQVNKVFSEISRLTGGATAKFNADAAQRLADLLKAVAAFAAGGIKALAAQNSEAAKLLLTQVRR